MPVGESLQYLSGMEKCAVEEDHEEEED